MNEDNFIDEFTLDEVEVDNDCISDDIDDYDLYAEKMIGDDNAGVTCRCICRGDLRPGASGTGAALRGV